MQTISLQVDFEPFKQKLLWIASKLEARDTRERLDELILDRLVQTVNGFGTEKLYELSGVATSGADVLGIRVEAAGILEELATALQALGFEFHEQIPLTATDRELAG